MRKKKAKKSLEGRFDSLEKIVIKGFEETRRGFAEINKRFEAVDQRFDTVDKRFETVDKRFETIDKHFEEVHQEIADLAAMTKKGFDEMNERFTRVDRYMLLEIEQLKLRVDRIEKALVLSAK